MRISLKSRVKKNYGKAKRTWLISESVAGEEDSRRQREGLGGRQPVSATE